MIINEKIKKTFDLMNSLLKKLDNGGYRVDFNGKFIRLSQSNVKLRNTYTDRKNNNTIKPLVREDIIALDFAFEEAVSRIPDIRGVDLTILFMKGNNYRPLSAVSEENCICNTSVSASACVAVFSVDHYWVWTYRDKLYTHEIGHVLGMDIHDDDVYQENPNGQYIMWSRVSHKATIWSPEARKRINAHDNSCLAIVESSETEIEVKKNRKNIINDLEAERNDKRKNSEKTIVINLNI